MARNHSTRAARSVELPKFWVHKASGNLAIKRKGRLYYLGKTEDEAAKFYTQYQERIENGQPIVDTSDSLTVGDICNHFLIAQQKRVDAGDISSRTYLDLSSTAKKVIKTLGRETSVEELRPRDFLRYKEMIAKTRNPIGVGNEVTRVRQIFDWAYSLEYLDRPMRYGPEFKRPKKKTIRRHKRLKGMTMFTPEEVNSLLDEAGLHLRAMIYLAVNCGFKNSDIGEFPLSEFNPKVPWLNWQRPKTEVARRCPLWPETVEALKNSLARRPKPKTARAKKAFFVHRNGDVWCTNNPNDQDKVRTDFVNAMRRLEIWRSGMGFSYLRHSFRTWADAATDQPAADLMMGHADDSMAAEYRQKISDARLLKVSETVRAILKGEREL